MEGGSGIELIKNIKAICPVLPEVSVIVLSMHDELFLRTFFCAPARAVTS